MPTKRANIGGKSGGSSTASNSNTMDAFVTPSASKLDIKKKKSDSIEESNMAEVTHNSHNSHMVSQEYLDQAMEKLAIRIIHKVDSLKEEMKEIKDRMDKTDDTIKTLDGCISNVQKDLSDLRTDLRKEIEDLKQEALAQQVYMRKGTLLIFGIPDTETNLQVAVKNIFQEKLQLDQHCVEHMMFVNIHRLPRRNSSVSKPVPVMVKFVRMFDRDMVMTASIKYSRALGKEISIKSDLPPQLKTLRSQLSSKAYFIRKNQKYLTKIAERGTEVLLYYRKSSQEAWKRIALDEELK